MLFGAAVWDPALIIAQIVTLQCLFYLSLGLCQGLFLGPYVHRLSIAYLFGWRLYNFSSYVGWISVLSSLLTAALGAVFLVWIVERAKKCLDFASTCYFYHLCFCWHFEGFPARFEWWLTHIVALIIMALFGEWLCLRREMQEIPLNTLRGRGASTSAASGSGAPASASTSAGERPGSTSAAASAVQMTALQMTAAGSKGGSVKAGAQAGPPLASNV